MTKPRWVAALIQALSRETSSGRFIPEIDGLRFMAIGSVLLFHLVGYIGLRVEERTGSQPELSEFADRAIYAVASVGNVGVLLFFGISGFILALPFAMADLNGQPRPPLRRYFLRRLTRLEPPYIINLLVWYAAQIFVKGGSALILFPHLIASIFYVHNIVYGEPSLINQVAWTLEIEVQFYILAPFLTMVFRVRSAGLRRGIIAAIMLLTPALQFGVFLQNSELVLRSILGQLQYFLVGFLLADIYLISWNQKPTLAAKWDVVSVAAWTGLWTILLTTSPALQNLLNPPLICLAYVAAFRGPWSRAFFCWRPIVLIGGMCYTIYLFHWMTYYTLGKATMRLYQPNLHYWQNYIIQLLTLVPLAIGACAILFVLFEKPFMRRHWVDDVMRWLGWPRYRKPAAGRTKSAACP
jgi:peptidoglycan/LPS O-acetylase OafA/YrhL